MVGKDRNCFMKNACISNTVPNMTFIVAGALTSAKEIASKQHRKRIESNAILYATDETWRHAKETVVVKCYSLSSLMNTLGHTHIDYFSLDVEGAEMIILHSIDWDKLDIDVFSMFYLYPRYASLHNIQMLIRITVSIFQHIDNGKYLVT